MWYGALMMKNLFLLILQTIGFIGIVVMIFLVWTEIITNVIWVVPIILLVIVPALIREMEGGSD